MDALAKIAILMTAAMLVMVGDNPQSFQDINQKILGMGHFWVLAAHTRQFAAGSSGGFLTLETKHFLIHSSMYFELVMNSGCKITAAERGGA